MIRSTFVVLLVSILADVGDCQDFVIRNNHGRQRSDHVIATPKTPIASAVSAAQSAVRESVAQVDVSSVRIEKPGPFQEKAIIGAVEGAAAGAEGGPYAAAAGAALGTLKVIGSNHVEKRLDEGVGTKISTDQPDG